MAKITKQWLLMRSELAYEIEEQKNVEEFMKFVTHWNQFFFNPSKKQIKGMKNLIKQIEKNETRKITY